MGIFDLFTFKSQAEKVFSPENFEEVLTTAKKAIVSQVKDKIAGQEKKENVDQIVISLIESKTQGCSNKIVLIVVSLITKAVPTVTQLVYNFLKEKVSNL